MLSSSKKLPMLGASLLILLLPACATQTTVPTEAKKVADAIGHVRPSAADTCETQNQVAAQSSRIETISTGKEVVFKADCKPPTKPAPVVTAKKG
jgi:hypothetical protein